MESFDKLKAAAISGDLETIINLKKDINIHIDNEVAFRFACSYGHLKMVQYLVNDGTDVHVLNDWGIRMACGHGNWKVLFYLLGKGANIHADNESALDMAAGKGHLDMVRFLIEEKGFKAGDNALVNAIVEGHKNVVEYLQSKSSFSQFDPFLNHILEYGNETHFPVVKFLIEKGAKCREKFGSNKEILDRVNAYENKILHEKKIKAVNTIATWWIPICYDMSRDCGKRMAEKSWRRVEEMFKKEIF